jgi:uncharacterized protein
MNPRTVLTLADGRNIDLLDPQPEDFRNPAWAAEHLAKENRYNGATPGATYSVAQHTVECVRAVIAEGGDKSLAAYLSLHDFHEALFKDDTTPKKQALAAIAEVRFGVLASAVLEAFDELTERADAAVHKAAGLQWPPPPQIAAGIKRIDRILLVTEWRDLMGGVPLPNAQAYADVQPLARQIIPLKKWRTAEVDLMLAWGEFVPALFDF